MQGGARILVRPVHFQRNGWIKCEAASNGSSQSGSAHGWLVLKDTESTVAEHAARSCNRLASLKEVCLGWKRKEGVSLAEACMLEGGESGGTAWGSTLALRLHGHASGINTRQPDSSTAVFPSAPKLAVQAARRGGGPSMRLDGTPAHCICPMQSAIVHSRPSVTLMKTLFSSPHVEARL
jgi:hypothetical protein